MDRVSGIAIGQVVQILRARTVKDESSFELEHLTSDLDMAHAQPEEMAAGCEVMGTWRMICIT